MPAKLSITCPACDHPLNSDPNLEMGFSVWCGNGKCENQVAGNGEDGGAAEDAAQRLVERVERDLEANETY